LKRRQTQSRTELQLEKVRATEMVNDVVAGPVSRHERTPAPGCSFFVLGWVLLGRCGRKIQPHWSPIARKEPRGPFTLHVVIAAEPLYAALTYHWGCDATRLAVRSWGLPLEPLRPSRRPRVGRLLGSQGQVVHSGSFFVELPEPRLRAEADARGGEAAISV
jgi:hypothetical protein